MESVSELARVRIKLDKLIESVGRVIAVHEMNVHLQYSRDFILKVNRSFASNGFITIQNELMASELLGVCKIWDKPDMDGYSLPTIVDIAQRPAVQLELKSEIASGICHHLRMEDAELREKRLDALIVRVKSVREGGLYNRAVNHRDKHLAHLLETTKREKSGKIDAESNAQYGDEGRLLKEAMYCIKEVFSLIVDGSLRLETYAEIHKNHADLFANSTQLLTAKEFNRQRT